MPRCAKRLIIALCLLALHSTGVEAAGLTTAFSEVRLENLEVGKSYTTAKAAGLPLKVVNTGDEPIDLKIDILMPDKTELKEGYEPIPDLSWIRLEQSDFKDIKPSEAAITDVIVSIPDEERYLGKKYQVYIWSHTMGRMVGVGLKSRLLISIAETKEIG